MATAFSYNRFKRGFFGRGAWERRTRPRTGAFPFTAPRRMRIGAPRLARPRFAGGQARVRAIRPAALLRTGGLLPYPSNIEKKFKDNSSTTNATTTAKLTLLNGMQMGTSALTRIGQRILVKSIQYNLAMAREDPALSTTQYVRVCVVYDRQANAVAPTNDMIFDTASGTIATWCRNLANAGRFFMISDRLFTFPGVNGGGEQSTVDRFFRRVNLPVYYNSGNAGDIADIQTGSIYVIYTGSSAAGADNVVCDLITRIRYTDM